MKTLVGNFSKKTFENITEGITETSSKLIYAIVILIIGIYVSKWIRKIVSKFLEKYSVSKGISNFIVYGVYISLLSIVAITCLDIMGIKTTSVVAVLGAAGFSIGLAFKEILSNVGSGMIILFFRPFAIGDYIQAPGVEGFVEDIQIFSTVLKTADNKTVIVPNFQLTSNNITNFTHQDKRRVDFSYNIAYDSDLDLVKKVLEDIFKEDKRIMEEPKHIIGINAIGNNAMQIVARPWVHTDDYWDVYFDVMEKVKRKFDENNIELAVMPGYVYFNDPFNGMANKSKK